MTLSFRDARRLRSHFADRPPFQLVVMGRHLTGNEGKGPKKIEFGYDSQYLSFFYDRERIEIVLPEKSLQFTKGFPARHRGYGTRHILMRRAFEKPIHDYDCRRPRK
jgi:hypothetical protein